MENGLPLTRQMRNELVSHMSQYSTGQDPLSYLQDNIFPNNPEHVSRIPTFFGRPPAFFYLDVVVYCETSAWAEEPPLIITLLDAFKPLHEYPQLVQAIVEKGPYRCHPSTQPFWVCRVASELPLFARYDTRSAAIKFSSGMSLNNQPGCRVLRVTGPSGSGKSYTLNFFEYLEAIQPLEVGVLHLDFGEGDLTTLAANEAIPAELYIARRLEEQVRRRRQRLSATNTGGIPLPLGLPGALPPPKANGAEKQFKFTELTDLQQRTRWAAQLADEFVNQVLARAHGTPPLWWVIVFDQCEKIPQLAEELIRQLVRKAAGTDSASAEEADRGPLRVVLLGDGSLVMPSPVYQDHLSEEDLTGQTFGLSEVTLYFQLFCLSRLIRLDKDDVIHTDRLQQLAQESINRAEEIMKTAAEKPLWPRALAIAVNEKTGPLESQAAQKRTLPPPPNGGEK